MVSLCAFARQLPVETASQNDTHAARYFTVGDSIGMSRFGRLDDEPVFSPDGKYVATVTSRGIIATDSIESTLWMFKTGAIRSYLQQGGSQSGVVPKIAARLSAVPKAPYSSSYEPIISNLVWTEDSRGLLFLAQNALGKHQLFRVGIDQKKPLPVTPPGQDVTQFDFAAGTLVYRVEEPVRPTEGAPVNSDARDITGLGLESILFPDGVADSSERQSSLWVNRNHKSRPVIDPNTERAFRLWNYPPVVWNVLSISPDGKSVVILHPVKAYPSSWKRYTPAYPHLRIRPQDPSMLADSNPARLTQYAVVDLTSGIVRPITQAPNGWALGYTDRNRAVWSSDAHALLLTNTYLPLRGSGDSSKLDHSWPCAAAYADLSSGMLECLAHRGERTIWDASFGHSSDEVSLWFSERDSPEIYRRVNGSWQREDHSSKQSVDLESECSASRRNPSGPLAIYVRQGLNDPPALWAADCVNARQRLIWNPNPQLASVNLGEVSVLRWKDEGGYEWTGALVMPPDYVSGKRYPLVIQAYGFEAGEFLSDGEFTTAFAARPLAAAGMIVLAVTERAGDQGTEQEADEQILGFRSAIEKLSGEGLIDRTRVGIIGFSRTSYYAESALIKYPDEFAAATVADGVDESYLQYLLFSRMEPGSATEAERIYGSPPYGKGLQVWVDRAPGFHIDQIRTPLRIEAIGPASVLSEWELYSCLRRQNKPVDLVYFPNGQHILQKPLDRMASQQGNVDWFRFWLKGEEDADPSKVLQYRGWRYMREQHLADERSRDVSPRHTLAGLP